MAKTINLDTIIVVRDRYVIIGQLVNFRWFNEKKFMTEPHIISTQSQ